MYGYYLKLSGKKCFGSFCILRLCKNILIIVGLYIFSVGLVFGQAVTFDNRSEVKIPEYATFRIGPFYSTVAFSQSVGYRWTTSTGTGTDYLYGNRRGEILKDGSDFPLITTLSFRNYLLITRNMDLDMSFWMSYEYYPLNTQEGGFFFDMPEEGVLGNIVLNYRITPVLTGSIYERFKYRSDYFDTRGYIDRYGGERYEHIDNTIGTRLNWDFARDKKVFFDFSREDIISFSDGFEDQDRTTYEEMLEYSQRVIGNISVGANLSFDQTSYKVDYRPDNSYRSFYLFARYNDGVGDDGGLHLKMSDFTTASIGIGYSAGLNGEVRAGDAIRDYEGVISTNSLSGKIDTSGDDFARFLWFANIKTLLRENVWHSLGYSSSVETGYRTAFEYVDRLEYQLEWHGDATTATLHSEYRTTEPSGNIFSDYMDWITRLDVSYPLTRIITLRGTLRYQIRDNEPVVLNEDLYSPETISDYTTWMGRVGASFDVTKKITFYTYYTHVSRDSDNDDLVYTRDIFEATFRYTHQF
jgi:hypothetical protein